jgi:hypothetical protein
MWNNRKKEKTKQMNQSDWQFLKLIQSQKLPILTLDPAWHALFVNGNKTNEVRRLEKKLTDLLKEQGRLTNANKDMQGQKKLLLGRIFNDMNMTGEENDKKRLQRRDMVEKINAEVVVNEDTLKMLPEQIQRVNEELLLETLHTVYSQVNINRDRIAELDTTIEHLRAELSRLLLEKQSREEYNHEVFGSLKNLVGMRPVDMYEETHPRERS